MQFHLKHQKEVFLEVRSSNCPKATKLLELDSISVSDFKIKSINWQPFEPRDRNSFLINVLDRIRNRTVTSETSGTPSTTSALTETTTSKMNSIPPAETQSSLSTSETSSKCSSTIDPALSAVLNDILKTVTANSDKLVSIEPKITKTLELATVISAQTSGIDEGFIRFNDHLSNLYEVIKAQSINSDLSLDVILTDNIEKLQILKRNSTNHRSKIKASTMKTPEQS